MTRWESLVDKHLAAISCPDCSGLQWIRILMVILERAQSMWHCASLLLVLRFSVLSFLTKCLIMLTQFELLEFMLIEFCWNSWRFMGVAHQIWDCTCYHVLSSLGTRDHVSLLYYFLGSSVLVTSLSIILFVPTIVSIALPSYLQVYFLLSAKKSYKLL